MFVIIENCYIDIWDKLPVFVHMSLCVYVCCYSNTNRARTKWMFRQLFSLCCHNLWHYRKSIRETWKIFQPDLFRVMQKSMNFIRIDIMWKIRTKKRTSPQLRRNLSTPSQLLSRYAFLTQLNSCSRNFPFVWYILWKYLHIRSYSMLVCCIAFATHYNSLIIQTPWFRGVSFFLHTYTQQL